jgi:membrane protein YqaA with SNARE-associated domain
MNRAALPERIVAFLWGAAEASLLFVVADLPLSWIALRGGLKRALIAALFAAVGAVPGGLALYAWSAQAPEAAARTIESLPSIPQGSVARAEAELRRPGWELAALRGAFTGMPYKVYAAAAPRAGVGAIRFALVTPLIRLPRYLLICLAFAWLGPAVRPRLSRRRMLGLFVLGWTLFYAAYWTFVGR